MLHSFQMPSPKVPRGEAPWQFQLDLGEAGAEPVGAVETPVIAEAPAEIFARVFRMLRPRTPLPEIRIEWRKYANVNSTIRLDPAVPPGKARLSLKISDILQGSPATVLESLAFILLGKLFRKPAAKLHTHRYNLYLNRRDVRRDMHLVRQARGRKFISGPKGAVYDLEPIFVELNQLYFGGMLGMPALGWSRTRNRRLLGHFDPCHNAIIISRVFDQAQVPKRALEFVMYHEMLHLRFPTQHRGARRCIHSKEFKQAEKEFAGWKEANEMLKRL